MGVVFFQKKVRKLYNENFHATYANRNFVLNRDYIIDKRICRVYSGRKQKATGFVYTQSSPYRNAEGSSQLGSFIHDAINNSSPIMGVNWKIGIVSTVSI